MGGRKGKRMKRGTTGQHIYKIKSEGVRAYTWVERVHHHLHLLLPCHANANEQQATHLNKAELSPLKRYDWLIWDAA